MEMFGKPTRYPRQSTLLAFAAAVLPALAWGQTNDLLPRVRASVTDTLSRLPAYMCTLTVDRTSYSSPSGRSASCDGLAAQRNKGQSKAPVAQMDRVRLDVGIDDVNEVYSCAWRKPL